MVASSVWWENRLRQMYAESEEVLSYNAWLRFLIAIVATVFIVCWALA